MTSSLILLDRCMRRLVEIKETGDVSELKFAINDLDAAGEILVHNIAKRGCLRCSPQGRIYNDKC